MKRTFFGVSTVIAVLAVFAPKAVAQIVYDLSTWNGDVRIMGASEYAGSGYSIANGDINGDGKDDVIIGAPFALGEDSVPPGETYVIYGRDNFPPDYSIDLSSLSADITIYGGDWNLFSGYCVSSGDINGDDKDDVMLSAIWGSPDTLFFGRVTYVIYGSDTFPPEHTIDLSLNSADITVYDTLFGFDWFSTRKTVPPIMGIGRQFNSRQFQDWEEFLIFFFLFSFLSGTDIASGDINGDTTDDMIIGAPFIIGESDTTFRGGVHVIYGSEAFPPNHIIDLSSGPADITVYADDEIAALGSSVSSGDINGDDIDDLIFGTPFGQLEDSLFWGDTYVIYGSDGFPPNHTIDLKYDPADINIYGGDWNLFLGSCVSSGDINGDSIDDVLIASLVPGEFPDTVLFWAALVVYGSDAFPTPHTIDFDLVNPDIVVADSLFTFGLFSGGKTKFPTLRENGWVGLEEILLFFFFLSNIDITSGDINRDTLDDLIIGVPLASPASDTLVGETNVVYGSDTFPPGHVIILTSVPADVTVYGDDAGDMSGYSVSSGDINGDGKDDMIIGAPGGAFLLAKASMSSYSGSSDGINGDRKDDIIIRSSGLLFKQNGSYAGETYVIYDADVDGIPDSMDNCLTVYNPNQENSDSDALGDSCDNCPTVNNPGQEDFDYDGLGNVCDDTANIRLTSTESGNAALHTSAGYFTAADSVGNPCPDGQPKLFFPHGFFSFTIEGLNPGDTVTITIVLPGNMPLNTEYWKCGPTVANPTSHWYQIPVDDNDGDNIIVISIVDGGDGDDDLTANGTITDQGGPGFPPLPLVPFFPPIAFIMFMILIIISTIVYLRRRKGMGIE